MAIDKSLVSHPGKFAFIWKALFSELTDLACTALLLIIRIIVVMAL